jgi:hypothetical protein
MLEMASMVMLSEMLPPQESEANIVSIEKSFTYKLFLLLLLQLLCTNAAAEMMPYSNSTFSNFVSITAKKLLMLLLCLYALLAQFYKQ